MAGAGFCPRCGSLRAAGAAFCATCGLAFDDTPHVPGTGWAPPAPPPGPPSAPPGSPPSVRQAGTAAGGSTPPPRRPLALWMGGALLGAVVAGLVGFVLGGGGGPTEDPVATVTPTAEETGTTDPSSPSPSDGTTARPTPEETYAPLTTGTAHVEVSGDVTATLDLPFLAGLSEFEWPDFVWLDFRSSDEGLADSITIRGLAEPGSHPTYDDGETWLKLSLDLFSLEEAGFWVSDSGECTIEYTRVDWPEVEGAFRCIEPVEGNFETGEVESPRSVTVTGSFTASP
ncbi:MAG: zinc ribbon domain-containing protein [Actinobacteria bacterium]|nr:zinc ribbon domain-containing protein [Actinomycetota bacterium]